MKSLYGLLRLRRGQAVSHKTKVADETTSQDGIDTSSRQADDNSTTDAVNHDTTIQAEEPNHSSGEIRLPTEAQLYDMRDNVELSYKILGKLETLVTKGLLAIDDDTNPKETDPVALSVNTHLADLNRCTTALVAILSECPIESYMNYDTPWFRSDESFFGEFASAFSDDEDDDDDDDEGNGDDVHDDDEYCGYISAWDNYEGTFQLSTPYDDIEGGCSNQTGLPVENPRGLMDLPVLDFGDPLGENSLFEYDISAFSTGDCSSPSAGTAALPGYFHPTTHQRVQQPSSIPPTGLQIAPLSLSMRGFSENFMNDMDINRIPSPFEEEMRYIDEEINESSLLSLSSSSSSVRLQHGSFSTNLPLTSWLTRRRTAESYRQQGLLDNISLPRPGLFPSNARLGLIPAGDILTWSVPRSESLDEQDLLDGRQFSTEAKMRRLRLLRRRSSPMQIHGFGNPMLSETTAGEEEEEEEEKEEPLGMDELMSFLREGNSMREL